MSRRFLITALTALALLGTTACGLGGATTGGGGGGPSGGGSAVTPGGPGGLAFEGGGIGIGSDGKVYRDDEAAQVQEVTVGGPLVPLAPRPLTVATISAADLQELYRKADDLDLLDEPVSTAGIEPAMDEMGYTVRIGVDGRVIEHEGLSSAADRHRDQRRLRELSRLLADLEATLGDGSVSTATAYRPHAWWVIPMGMEVTDEPRDWVHGPLPDKRACVTLASSTPTDTVTAIYRDGTKDYLVRPAFPWDECAPVTPSS